MDQISVIIPTYNRAGIVKKCIEHLKSNFIYDGDIIYHVGCDGDDDTPEVLCGMDKVVIHTHRTGSLGANLNRLIMATDTNFLIQMDDDHILNRPVDLNPHVNRLVENKNDGWIRLMGIGYHNYHAELDGNYWRVRWDSPFLYIPSNRPHIKTRRFHEVYGLYPEGVSLGQTEEGFCGRCKEIALSKNEPLHDPVVLVPLNSESETAWTHEGNSWQLKGF